MSFRNIFVVIGIFYLIIIHRQVKNSFKKLLNLWADAESENLGWISIKVSPETYLNSQLAERIKKD